MKFYKRYFKGKVFVYVSLWAFLITGQSYQALADNPSGDGLRIIPDDEMPIVLDLIANQMRDNYERIITWSGEIDVKINSLITGDTAEVIFEKVTDANGEPPVAILQKVEEKTVFVIDANKNYVYIDNFREKPGKYFHYIDGRDLGNKGASPYRSTLIARPDFFIEAKPKRFDIKDNTIIQRKAVKRPSRQEPATGFYVGIFSDPRRIYVPGGGYTWNHLGILKKKINRYGKIEFDGYSLQMEEHIKGNVIEYKIIEPSVVSLERSDPNHYVIITKIFSSQCGFNMTYWEAATGSGMVFQKITWEYELINGVYLPKRVVQKDYRSNGEVGYEKGCTYTNSKLNQKIPSETFEYTNLKLKDGDIFIDEILKKEYRYNGATKTLKPVEK